MEADKQLCSWGAAQTPPALTFQTDGQKGSAFLLRWQVGWQVQDITGHTRSGASPALPRLIDLAIFFHSLSSPGQTPS